jgi:hypothetical protein
MLAICPPVNFVAVDNHRASRFTGRRLALQQSWSAERVKLPIRRLSATGTLYAPPPFGIFLIKEAMLT